jgi:lipopolysaccharide/colanic/teichoic acid biosynthesis glycosyltransferase
MLSWMRGRALRVEAQSEQFCSDLASALVIRMRSNSPVKTGENHMSNDVPPAFQNNGFFSSAKWASSTRAVAVSRSPLKPFFGWYDVVGRSGGMMRLDDGQLIVQDSPSAARDGTELMLRSERIHRIFDFVAAATGVILLAPIFLVTSIAIKLDSHGPVFIREPKFGPGNRRIQLFKFRLVCGCGDGNTPARLTRVGRVLCETGIDELPQLFNVLRGELSIIGPPPSPRPDPPLNKIKPGMIQWAQIVATRKRRSDGDWQ